jgi:PAS domain S-box-containing protein
MGRRTNVLEQAVGYAAALILPWLGTVVSTRLHALQGTPLALSFASIAVITALTGLWPGVVATVCTTVCFNYYVLPPNIGWSLGPRHVVHTAAVFGVGTLVTYLCHRQNVTRDRLRAALALLQAQTDALMEAQRGSNSAVWTLNVPARKLQWAEGGAEIFGRPFSEVRKVDWPIELIVEEDRARFEQAIEDVFVTENGFQFEFRVRWPNGDIHWLEARGNRSPTDMDVWRGVTIDVTDRKNAELALIRTEKLAAVGRLSATIAHEINNPLEAVTNLIYLASSDPALPVETKQYIERADEELGRLAAIARHTLSFARTRSSSGPAKISEIIDSVVSMFQPKCNSHGGQIRIIQNPELLVSVPPDELRQILTNIVSNACDAVSGPRGLVEIEVAERNGESVVEVRDNGEGIERENLGRIFDPFFTTKEDAGTGIGLWVTKELVEKSAGMISVHVDHLPEGFRTMFRLELPLA